MLHRRGLKEKMKEKLERQLSYLSNPSRTTSQRKTEASSKEMPLHNKAMVRIDLVTSHAALLLLGMETINRTFLFGFIKTSHSLPPYSKVRVYSNLL